MAVQNGHANIAKLLLEHKCNVNAKDCVVKFTALHWAVEKDHPNIVELLLEYGANPHALNSCTGFYTPTTFEKSQSTLTFILSLNFYICSNSIVKDTPISLAEKYGFDNIYRTLTTYQSSVSMQEQEDATNSLMQEMESDSSSSFEESDMDIGQVSTSYDDNATATPTIMASNLTNSTLRQHNCTYLCV